MRARYRLKWCLLLLAFTVQGAESRVPVRLDGLFEVFLLFGGGARVDVGRRPRVVGGVGARLELPLGVSVARDAEFDGFSTE